MNYDDNLISIDSDDNNDDYVGFTKFIKEYENRQKSKIINDIEERGNVYLKEIERKKKENKHKINKLVPYILKKSPDKYSLEELTEYSYKDVLEIYNEVKKENRPFIVKMFYFIFNL